MDKRIKIIIVVIVILILLALNLMVFINNNFKSDDSGEENKIVNTIVEHNIATEEETEQSRKEMLNGYTEATRIKSYVGQYLSYVDSKDYESAYNLLYEEFKNTYFKTLEDFVTYAENKYPDEIFAEYTNMEREGTIYIVTVKLKDTLNKDFAQIEQNIVVKENDLNDFVLSFEVE